MKHYLFLLVIAVSLLPVPTQGQEEMEKESVFSSYLNPYQPESFLRIPGLDFHSSMGFSYFSSNGFGSIGMGYYMGHFDLQLTSSLSLHWDVGIRSNLTDGSEHASPEFFLPNVDLTYRPNDKFFLRLQYQQLSYPYYRMRRRY